MITFDPLEKARNELELGLKLFCCKLLIHRMIAFARPKNSTIRPTFYQNPTYISQVRSLWILVLRLVVLLNCQLLEVNPAIDILLDNLLNLVTMAVVCLRQ